MSALLIDPVDKRDGVGERFLQPHKELQKSLGQEGAPQEQNRVGVIVQLKGIPEGHRDLGISDRPLLGHAAGNLIDFDTADRAGRVLFQQECQNPPFPAAHIQKGILQCQGEVGEYAFQDDIARRLRACHAHAIGIVAENAGDILHQTPPADTPVDEPVPQVEKANTDGDEETFEKLIHPAHRFCTAQQVPLPRPFRLLRPARQNGISEH